MVVNAIMDSTLTVFLALLFVFGIPCVITFLIFYFEHVRKPLELARMRKYDEYIDSKKTIKEKVIVKEVVMIPCQYCDSLMSQTSLFYHTTEQKEKAKQHLCSYVERFYW